MSLATSTMTAPSGPVTAAYADLATRGVLVSDPAQHTAAGLLDQVLVGVVAEQPKSFFGKLFDKPETATDLRA